MRFERATMHFHSLGGGSDADQLTNGGPESFHLAVQAGHLALFGLAKLSVLAFQIGDRGSRGAVGVCANRVVGRLMSERCRGGLGIAANNLQYLFQLRAGV